MREWYRIAELVGLPGQPRTRRGVLWTATQNGWQSRESPGRGGGREYHVNSLPEQTRAALLLRQRGPLALTPYIPEQDPSGRARELWASYEGKSAKAKEEATRRVNAVLAVEQFVRDGCERLEAYTLVATQLAVSESTIANWCRAVRGEPQSLWAPLLLPKYTGRTARRAFASEIYDWFRDQYLDASRPPATVCYDRTRRIAEARGLTMPSYATLMRELKRREDPTIIILEREGERALQAAYPYLERSVAALYAMQMVNADGHELDLAVAWPDGERVRATLLTVQDLYSRAVVGWKLLKSESAHGMSLAFLETFDTHGIPQRLFLDNTLAAASKRLTAGAPGRKRFRDREDDPIGVLPLLGVTVTFVTPAHGQAKPIERAFGTLRDLISKHPAFSGAYLGSHPKDKPANYGERVLTIAELEPIVREQILIYNTTLGRRTETAGGTRSYWDVFSASYAEHAHQVPRLTANQRRLLYLVAERVTVDRRDGCVTLFKNRYWSEEVSRLRGTQVVVRYHPTESLHESVWVYRLDGTLVGQAPIYAKAGFADADAAQAHTRARRQFVKTKKELAKAKRRLDAAEVAAIVPPVAPPAAPAAGAIARAANFALPSAEEQLGQRTAKREAREIRERVSTAIAKLAEARLEPKSTRKRA